ncbi:MAG: hypothetical protein QG582_1044 [Candidatus Thermoplasmatota archaeon]|nr:hypothetical protein [Candidatus Thermoplasmatota archaeon]
MKTGAMSKLSAAIIVLVLALSAMVALPMVSVDAADGTNDINLLVLDNSNGATVETATVNLINLYTGEVVEAPYSSGMYVASEPQPGVYRVEVTDGDYYDKIDAVPEGISFDGLSPYTSDPIDLVPFMPKTHEWNVTVENSYGQPMSGVTVGFYDNLAREVVAQATTNSAGWAIVDMFSAAFAAEIYLFASEDNYETEVELVEITGDDSRTMMLSSAKIVRGIVRDADGYLATNTVAYLVNDDTSVPWIKRALKSDLGGGSYVLYGYIGTFTLSVDADGLKSEFRTVAIDVSTTYKFEDFVLDPQTQRTETVSMEYGADFNSFEMTVDTIWSYDDKVPGMPYNDVGSLRMQIDMAFGNADGAVDLVEAGDFEMRLADYGPEYVSSKRLLTVNDTAYSCSGDFGLYTLGAVDGDITLEAGVSFTYSASYSSEEAIDVGAPDYSADAYVKYDDPSVDFVYTFALPNVLPDRYELVANSTGNSDSHVNSTGFMVFSLDPQEYVGGPEHVTLTFEKSEAPSAGASVVDTEYVYAVTNETGVVLSYIVAVDEEVNFSAVDSMDPNGNPLMFTWDFGDGTPQESTFNVTIPHTYISASANRTVNLTVTDMGDLVNETSVQVMCDGQDPVPVITIKDLEVNATSGMLEIDQGELVWFNATDSTDDAVSVGDGMGTVQFIEFFYGEGNTSGRVYETEDEKNVSYSWSEAGEYTLTLNVTDSVGHWKNTTLKVMVNDTENPVPSFTVKNATWGTSLVENKTLVFDANATIDNLDDKEDLNFSWYFNDDQGADSWLNGTGLWNVTHVFEGAGSFAVRLNVTDTEGNWNGYTKTVTVVSGPRPNLVIDSITFDPEAFTEGETGYILVNITNRGSAVATEIVLEFAIQNADGTEESIGTWTIILNRTTDAETGTLGIGATAYAKFPYKFSDPGSFTIKVNVTSADQLSVDEDVGDVTVEEAGWKEIALWGGVLAVIILVPLLIYVRGRWSKRERKGPRREKAEKAEKAEKKPERSERPEKPGKGDEDL